MNKAQAPKLQDIEQRRLPAYELRVGSIVTLAATSPTSRMLPETVGQCVGGSYGVVTAALYSDMPGFVDVIIRHAKAPHPSGAQRFRVPFNQRVLVRMPVTHPEPFTPVGLAEMYGFEA